MTAQGPLTQGNRGKEIFSWVFGTSQARASGQYASSRGGWGAREPALGHPPSPQGPPSFLLSCPVSDFGQTHSCLLSHFYFLAFWFLLTCLCSLSFHLGKNSVSPSLLYTNNNTQPAQLQLQRTLREEPQGRGAPEPLSPLKPPGRVLAAGPLGQSLTFLGLSSPPTHVL